MIAIATKALQRLMAAAAFVVGVSTLAGATTISNIASISWQQNGQTVSQPSNQVDITVAPAQAPLSATTYQLDDGSTNRAVLRAPTCGTSANSAPVPISALFSNTNFSAAGLTPSTAIHAGEVLVFRIVDPAGNHDPAAIDMIDTTIVADSGDRETLTVSETGPDTGLFVGYVQTQAAPPAAQAGDCVLTVGAGDKLMVQAAEPADGRQVTLATVDVSVTSQGIVFDSQDGTPIDGASVTLIDAATGQPAVVYGNDGHSRYPSTVVSGTAASDADGNSYPVTAGQYRFPLVPLGSYRLQIASPSGYRAPSQVAPAQLAQLHRPDGGAFVINDGSFGAAIPFDGPLSEPIDIPLDRPAGAFKVTKAASQPDAVAGEFVLYSVTVQNPDATHSRNNVTLSDRLPDQMRLKPGSVRIDGAAAPSGAVMTSNDDRTLIVSLGTLAPSQTRTVRYTLEVRPDAKPGDALNKAVASDLFGNTGAADALVRIKNDVIGSRMTVIGRVSDKGCGLGAVAAKGVPGVRVMMEDGSYAVTDKDGLYHFEGVTPGTHVVQIDPDTLPPGQVPVDCTRSVRSGGSAISHFVIGQGGDLLRADFHSVAANDGRRAAVAAAQADDRPAVASDQIAAGAQRDWFAGGSPSIDWLFPATDYNPRAPITRVAIRHLKGQTVTLSANGKPVDPVSFDGTRPSPAQDYAVSLWRGVPLGTGTTHFAADVRNADGSLAQHLERDVHFVETPARAVLLADRSHLIADGVSRPVLAVRFVDRDGRPVHKGLVGEFAVPNPYLAAVEADAQQARQLSGLDRAKPTWQVATDDGVAYIELEPTTASGALTLTLPFRDGEISRSQQIDTWLEPGNRPWTIVGFAAGSLGYQTLNANLAALDEKAGRFNPGGRIALYAKGRVLGKWLMTMSYDSDKQRDETRFAGTIDPNAYYTVYADRSERRYDAASVRKLYLRLERKQFYAMFGDYETGFNETELGRYNRSANGLKAAYRGPQVAATVFATNTPDQHRRDEIQGNGLSGPYGLSARDILPNSERIVIEARDRLRSELILSQTVLVRNIDYDIDYAAGTIRFREPITSRTTDLNPQFIVADYEVERGGKSFVNAGARGTWQTKDGRVRVGGTALSDQDASGTTRLGAGDVRVKVTPDTELRGEVAVSAAHGDSSTAWLAEAEHRGRNADLLAYVRQQDQDFGLAQQSIAERGRRKAGVDGRIRINDRLSASLSGYIDDSLTDAARSIAGKGLLEYRGGKTLYRAGLTIAADTLADRSSANTVKLQLGATQHFLDNRLEVDAQGELALDKAKSVDNPEQQRLTARFAVNPAVTLVGTYELANGRYVDARTARIGFDLKPWAGAKLSSSLGSQDAQNSQSAVQDYGPRTFAAYGLAQSLQLGKHWSVDASLDGNHTLHGIDPDKVVNPAKPAAAGGFLTGNAITEDFTALSVGATYRADRWSGTGRIEHRIGSLGDRSGASFGMIRQIGEGRALGGLVTWTKAALDGGPRTAVIDAALSFAYRPPTSPLAILDKLEFRSDAVRNAVEGAAGPIGGAPLTVSGDVKSRRLLNSFSLDYAPYGRDEDGTYQRVEASLFLGTRYTFNRYDDTDVKGWSEVIGLDARVGINGYFEAGISGTARGAIGRAVSYAIGPTLGVRAFKNGLISVGWNLAGYSDRDYNALRYSHNGPYVTLRFKFDQTSFAGIGLSK